MTGLLIVKPSEIKTANISASNIALETLWSSGTAYTAGNIVRYSDRLWRCIVANTNSEPTATNTNWLDVGPPNRLACFDIQRGTDKLRVVETRTKSAGDIEYTIIGLGRVTAISFFGLSASRIVISTAGGFTHEYDLKRITPTLGSFFNWFYGRIARETQYILRDLNIPPSETITITISNGGAACSVGSIVLGSADIFGVMTSDPTRSTRSRSVVKFDGTTTTLIRRYPVPSISYNLMLYNNDAAAFWFVADQLEAIAAVFGPSDGDHPELFAYGVMQNPQTVKRTEKISDLSLEVIAL